MPLGNRGQGAAQAVEQLLRHAAFHRLARGFGVGGLVQARPATGEPVGLVGLVALGRFELVLQMVDEVAGGLADEIIVDQPFGLQASRINVADRRMLADLGIHLRLGERRLVAFIMAEAAIAPHVDHDVAMEFLAIFHRQLAGEGHGFGIVAIDVQDRRLDALGHVAGIGRAARELRAGGEADLVVDDEMDAAAGIVAGDAREAETFPHDALARKGRVAMDQHRQHLLMLGKVVAEGLLRAHLAQDHRIDGFEVRGIGDQRHVDLDPVKLAVGRGAEVIFDVARSADILRIGGAAGKFVENDAEALGHDIGQHVEAAAMRHAEHDFAHAARPAIFDDGFERGDHGFAAVQTKALGPDIFAAQELLILLGLDDLGQDRLLALGREVDFLVLAFHPVLQEAALLHVGDMHIFQADIAAVILPQDRHQFADGRILQTERTAEVDLLVEVGQTMIFRRQVGRLVTLGQAQRIEIGGQMPAHPIGADQHHGADAVFGGGGDVRVRHGLALRLGSGLHGHLHLRGVQRAGQIIRIRQRPIVARPARSALDLEILVLVTHRLSVPAACSRGKGRMAAGVQPGHLICRS